MTHSCWDILTLSLKIASFYFYDWMKSIELILIKSWQSMVMRYGILWTYRNNCGAGAFIWAILDKFFVGLTYLRKFIHSFCLFLEFKKALTHSQDMLTIFIRMFKQAVSFLRFVCLLSSTLSSSPSPSYFQASSWKPTDVLQLHPLFPSFI